jgi:hypothetical protein
MSFQGIGFSYFAMENTAAALKYDQTAEQPVSLAPCA